MICTLWYMTPSRTPKNHIDCFSTDAQFLSHVIDIRSARFSISYFNDLLSGQLRIRTLFTSYKIIWMQVSGMFVPSKWSAFTAVFPIHISDIISNRSKKEMIRSDAGSIVAGVQNPKITRNLAVMYFPRDAMGLNNSLPVCCHDGSIAFGFRSSPFPAASKVGAVIWHRSILVYLGPKAAFQSARTIYHTLAATVLAATVRYLAGFNFKLLATVSAYATYSISLHWVSSSFE